MWSIVCLSMFLSVIVWPEPVFAAEDGVLWLDPGSFRYASSALSKRGVSIGTSLSGLSVGSDWTATINEGGEYTQKQILCPGSFRYSSSALAGGGASIGTSMSVLSVGSNGTAAVNEGGGYTQEQINEMINNPLGELWILFGQNDYTSYTGDALDFLGEGDKVFNTTIFQPVMPFQLTEDWKYIFRPVFQVHNWEAPSISRGTPTHYPGGTLPASVDFDHDGELGDTVLWNAFATNEMAAPPDITGVGFTAMVPTASDDRFGTGKWGVGPMAVAAHLGPPGGFIYGAVAQHWWDVAGDSDRDHINLTNIQYFGYYRLSDSTNIGFGPNIIADWTADDDNRWTIPVGIGINTTVKLGRLPVKIGLEYYTYVEKPDSFGPDWTIRLIFAPIIPKPAFSKKPLFGN